MLERVNFGRLILAALTLFNACVDVPSRETRILSDPRTRESLVREQALGELKVRSFVYKPTVWPLRSFLRTLARGDVKRARRAFNLRYIPTKARDKALKDFLKLGYIPAYLEIQNAGERPVDLKDLKISLADERVSFAPVPNEKLPTAMQGYNPKAAAANAYNVGVIVVSSAALIVAGVVFIIAAFRGEGGGGGADGGKAAILTPFYGIEGFGELANDRYFNETTKTVDFDYNDLVWKPGILAPGGLARGILFFNVKGFDETDLAFKAEL